MRYSINKESDGSNKVIIEFGTTEDQKKLETAFLSYMESLIYMQDIFITKDVIPSIQPPVPSVTTPQIQQPPVKPMNGFYSQKKVMPTINESQKQFNELDKLESGLQDLPDMNL